MGPAKRSNAAPQKVARSSDNPSSGMSRSRSAAIVDQIPISNRTEPSSPLASENSQNNSGEFEEDNSLGSQAENDRSNSNSSVKSSAQDVHSTTSEYSLDIVYPDLPLDASNSPATERRLRSGLKRMEYRKDQIVRVIDPEILTSLYPEEINLACRIHYQDSWLVVKEAIRMLCGEDYLKVHRNTRPVHD